MDLISQLRREEGVSRHAYQDHLGFWTIGVGRLVDQRKGGGLTDEEVDYLLRNDVNRFTTAVLKELPWASTLDEPRLAVLIGMAFQMGVAGLLGFKETLAHAKRGDYAGAATMMLTSRWGRQTPARAGRMAKQMETGQWQA